jgi:ABC-type nitrate/sulfonate/bicarbonate transport system permease component
MTTSSAVGTTGAPAGQAGTPKRRRLPANGYSRSYAVRVKLLTALVILLIWELFVRAFAPAYVARPSGVVLVLPEVVVSPQFLTALGGTLVPIVQGMVLAVSLGVLVGLAMGRVSWMDHALKLYVYGLFALPMVAVVPLVTMWFGYNEGARLAIIIFAAFFPMAISVYDGARSVSRDYLEVAESFRANRRSVWLGVVLPASLPYLLAGFRLAAGRALIGAVVAEYLLGIEGLGFYILFNARSFRHDEAFVAVIALALFGVGTLLLARWGTRRLCPWYHQGVG